jgi:transcription elongation factor Elf1
MVKFQCDRCEKETVRGYRIVVPPKKNIDLCEECEAAFEEFMKGVVKQI